MTNITHLSTIERPLPATYAAFVEALKKPGDDIHETMTGQKADLLHMAIGLSGECAELLEPFLSANEDREKLIDRVNVVEELGDIEFFFEGIFGNLERSRDGGFGIDMSGENRMFLIQHLIVVSGGILDTVKRNVVYGKDLDRLTLSKQLGTFDDLLWALYKVLGVTRKEVIDHNVEKLATRYASLNYSDAQAQARADKA